MGVSFPSTDYFEALKARMTEQDEKFRRLGYIDTTFGVSVGHTAVPKVPGASHHDRRSIIPVRVSPDPRIRRHTEANCVRARLCGVAHEHGRANTGDPRGSCARLVCLKSIHFCRSEANLGQGRRREGYGGE